MTTAQRKCKARSCRCSVPVVDVRVPRGPSICPRPLQRDLGRGQSDDGNIDLVARGRAAARQLEPGALRSPCLSTDGIEPRHAGRPTPARADLGAGGQRHDGPPVRHARPRPRTSASRDPVDTGEAMPEVDRTNSAGRSTVEAPSFDEQEDHRPRSSRPASRSSTCCSPFAKRRQDRACSAAPASARRSSSRS